MSSNEIRDALPNDLDISAFVGPYQFPDNHRRRIPGFIYLCVARHALVFGSLRDRQIRHSQKVVL